MKRFILVAVLFGIALLFDQLSTTALEEALAPISAAWGAAIATGLGVPVSAGTFYWTPEYCTLPGVAIYPMHNPLYHICTIGGVCAGLRTMVALTLLLITDRVLQWRGGHPLSAHLRQTVSTLLCGLFGGFILNAWRIAMLVVIQRLLGHSAMTIAHDHATLLILLPTCLAWAFLILPFLRRLFPCSQNS